MSYATIDATFNKVKVIQVLKNATQAIKTETA